MQQCSNNNIEFRI